MGLLENIVTGQRVLQYEYGQTNSYFLLDFDLDVTNKSITWWLSWNSHGIKPLHFIFKILYQNLSVLSSVRLTPTNLT